MYKKSVDLSLESVLVEIDENKKLMPSRNATVQPVALMRLGLFLPSLKRKGKDTENI
ncbi:protein RepA, partial [Enterobacter hormaechei]